MTSQEQIEVLRSAKAILENQGFLDSHVLGVLDRCSLQLGNEQTPWASQISMKESRDQKECWVLR